MGNRKETFEFVYLKNCSRGSACDRVLISFILLEREENVDFFCGFAQLFRQQTTSSKFYISHL